MTPQRSDEGRMEPRLMCAWCDEVLREGKPPVSHGICEPCAERELYRFHLRHDPPWVWELYFDEGGEG